MARKPINQVAVAEMTSDIATGLEKLHSAGNNGLDVVLAAISAIRMFTLKNAGSEGLKDELKELAENLENGV